MEEKPALNLISVSDLLHHRRPLTGASSFFLSRPIHRSTLPKHRPQLSDSQSPNIHKILKPLGYPTLLIGTLNLTVPSISCTNSSCLKFSDDSAALCCDILDFDLRAIGQRIRVDAWNFLPLKPDGGHLEIIRWSLDQSDTIPIPIFNAFYLNSVFPTYEESIIPRHLLYGLLESVSPVTNVPCTANKTGSRNLNGFLAEISVCECKLCCSKDMITPLEHITRDRNNSHNFSKSKILYFCGSASIWYPAISRLVGGILFISGMKKKMVFLGEGKSLMMYVTTEKAILHLPMSKSVINGRSSATRGKGLISAHTGSITGVYLQGMLIELDHKVLLLLTDHQLSMPHSLRIGAIVTVRNFHIEDPKFSWTKVQIFGSCYKTSIHVDMFSPKESGCYQTLQSISLLRKFIESLTCSSRLWVLLVVSSLRKKFAGVLSEMEILGSKHMEGLVQKYSSSRLHLSVFRFRHGVVTEYCLHDLCECGKEIDYNPPKLVVPISNLISHCEDTLIKSFNANGTNSDTNHQYSNFVCGGTSHDQPIRKILKSEDMNVVLLGSLKISECSGKLQLIDATGSIDIIIPDLPSIWSVNDIFEINDFTVVIEGFPQQLEHSELLNNEPFSCRNIFNSFDVAGRKSFTIYIHCYIRDANSRNHILCPSIDREENLKELESGSFHLLQLSHKFPLQQKFSGDNVVSKTSSVYAEAISLPWNLILHTEGDYLKFPSTIDCRVFSDKSMISLGNLVNCTVTNISEASSCKISRKLLLEFTSDSFYKYEFLKIGGYYLMKHHKEDLICTRNDKVIMDSKSHLWSVALSADNNEFESPNSCEVEIPLQSSINGCPEICPDIYLNMSVNNLSLMEVKLKEITQDLIQPTKSIKGLLFNSPWSPMLSEGFSVNLPKGNLLSVQGHVAAVHNSDHYQSRLVPHHRHGVTNACIHVLIEDTIVKIYSNSLSKRSYPIGFGPGVKATFHRLLLTAEGDVLKLTPASFIEINSIVVDELNDSSVKSVVETTYSTDPAVLISDMIQFSDHKPMRLHCKVVTIYFLIMEKKNELIQSFGFATVNSEVSSVKFPLAGFIMDDGSSLCCCWTDNEKVATLLGLHKRMQPPLKRPKRSSQKTKNKQETENNHMNKILDQHGKVVIKNRGYINDSSCLEFVISASSDNIISESDEQFLKSLMLQSCSINTWNVVGSVLDSKGVTHLEEQLRRLDSKVVKLRNIWVSEVSHVDTLNEGRSILQQLLNF